MLNLWSPARPVTEMFYKVLPVSISVTITHLYAYGIVTIAPLWGPGKEPQTLKSSIFFDRFPRDLSLTKSEYGQNMKIH